MFIYMFVRMAQSIQDRNLNACYNQLIHGETGVDSGQTLNADKLLDACGLNCPLPLLKAKQALNAMESGLVLEVICTDSGSVRDFQVFSEQSGHKLLASDVGSDVYRYWLQKK